VTTASSTRVLAVGISEYTVPSLHLRYAATNAADLVSALELESGCSIPPSNIKTLVESQATRTTVVETLAQVSSNCGDDDVLIFFFQDTANGPMMNFSFCRLEPIQQTSPKRQYRRHRFEMRSRTAAREDYW
jgi:hypothetical protein